ncbi:IS1478 transposase [Xanthomonas oryzae pv. oryzae KACC 10331]|uniref:IS1478 transposase n=3 Tax=Xanthomonas oryzae TaxID=347 RepID=Q5GYF0_XANOR|nr:IS1478 transposase [Xanthomonas oryzae pv. oryzae KACC 10331]
MAHTQNADFFRQPLAEMIDPRHPLAVLARRLPWAQIEAVLAPHFARKVRAGRAVAQHDLFGPSVQVAGAGIAAAGRPRLPIRLMASLLDLKHAYKFSDEELVERWAENVVWQHFSGMAFYEPRLPCDATQVGRFRAAIGEAGVEELLKATIDTAVSSKAIVPAEFERLIVDTTVQEKAIAHPVDWRLMENARHKLVAAAKRAGIALKQTFAKETKTLRRKAGGYAHARQFKRLRKVLKRQRTLLGIVLREVQRKIGQASQATAPAPALENLHTLMQRAERIHAQQPNGKNKLYALHAPEVECIGKGKARKPYEFGVKVSVAITHKQGLMVGACSFTGTPYDGHTLHEQVEQARILSEDTAGAPKQVVVDLGFRGVDAANPGVEIIHRGTFKRMTDEQRRWVKPRQAVEPAIGHLKHANGMDRCWLQGAIRRCAARSAVRVSGDKHTEWLLAGPWCVLGLKGLFAPMVARLIMLATVLAMSLRARNTRPHRLAWCVW